MLVAVLEHDGLVGYGECSPSGFYNESRETARAALAELEPWLIEQDPVPFRALLAEAAERLGENRAALCALDLAVHDLAGKRLGVPLHTLFGLRAAPIPPTTYTIGLGSIDEMTAKLRERPDHPVYKIKLGAGAAEDDLAIIAALRRETDAPFRVDANCGWEPEQTIEISKELKRLGVEFIEQPLAPERLEEMEEVYWKSAIPIIADENSRVPGDVPRLAGRFHGFNIKLVKCGGLAPAMRMIELGRALNMKLMIGCMIESSNCCTAAAHLGSLVDYLDLDGPLLIENDPFTGMRVDQGRIELPEGPGLGVELNP